MAQPTRATQLRTVTINDKVAKFQVTMVLTDRGDLPDGAIFLKNIVDETDPKEDTFARVARAGDLIVYSDDRDEAIDNGDNVWRDTELTKFYDAVDTANTAAEFMQERVNALVDEYRTFTNEFEADPAVSLAFPQNNIGIFSPLVDDYTDKVEARKAQEDTVDDKQAECDEIDDKYDDAVETFNNAQATLDALNKAQSALSSTQTTLQSQYNAAQSLQADITGALGAWASIRSSADPAVQSAMDPELDDPGGNLYDEYHNNYKAKITELSQEIDEISAKISDINTQIATQTARRDQAESDKEQLLQDKEDCAADLVAAQSTLDALEREEADLLSEIQSLCPTYTP